MARFFDLSHPRRVHIVGVGGPGMSAVALCLADMGNTVTGSDVRENSVVNTLRSRGVTVFLGHDESHITGAEAVVYSTAVPLDNIEIVAARANGVDVMHRAGMLAAICSMANAVGVSGTHGKTTTSAMLLAILQHAGRRPSYAIGAEVLSTGMGAEWTGSDVMIVEADESDGTHAALPLHGTIVTNIDQDHLDFFGSIDGEFASFLEYAGRVRGPVVLCDDDENTRRLARALRERTSGDVRILRYGSGPDCDSRISGVVETTSGTSFNLSTKVESATVVLPVFGRHNVLNATAAITMALECGASIDSCVAALATYGGVERRFEIRGEARGAVLVDDYAHLPAEIEAALSSARQRFPGKRVVAVFQPNRFHRIQAMAGDYAHCFSNADHVAITDVYASGTPRIEGVTGKLVVDAVVESGCHASVAWCQSRDELVRHVAGQLDNTTVCLSMGCGDIEFLPDEVTSFVESSGEYES